MRTSPSGASARRSFKGTGEACAIAMQSCGIVSASNGGLPAKSS
jgi:hypothetical protein